MSYTHPRFKPVEKLDNVRVFHALKHIQLVQDHALIAFNVLLQDDLNGDLATTRAFCLSHDAIGSRAEGSTESVFGPVRAVC